MKIRALTFGVSLNKNFDLASLNQLTSIKAALFDAFNQAGIEIQDSRLATNPWTVYCNPVNPIPQIQELEAAALELGSSFLSVGYASELETISLAVEIILNTKITSCSAKFLKSDNDLEHIKSASRVIKRLSTETPKGYGNFWFCAMANCPPGIPFFPAGYHEGPPALSIGLESSDLLMKAFIEAGSYNHATEHLAAILNEQLSKIEQIAAPICERYNIFYNGIDSSLAPSLEASESVAFAFEKLGYGKFGQPGTLAIAAQITDVLKSLKVKTCGYNGLMLPVCEDYGLVQRANEGHYNLSNLLQYSAVCGCGYDTIPLPGDISIEKLSNLILDVANLSNKLNKPLAARLIPFPGKSAGQMTEFDSPYLLNCKCFPVD